MNPYFYTSHRIVSITIASLFSILTPLLTVISCRKIGFQRALSYKTIRFYCRIHCFFCSLFLVVLGVDYYSYFGILDQKLVKMIRFLGTFSYTMLFLFLSHFVVNMFYEVRALNSPKWFKYGNKILPPVYIVLTVAGCFVCWYFPGYPLIGARTTNFVFLNYSIFVLIISFLIMRTALKPKEKLIQIKTASFLKYKVFIFSAAIFMFFDGALSYIEFFKMSKETRFMIVTAVNVISTIKVGFVMWFSFSKKDFIKSK